MFLGRSFQQLHELFCEFFWLGFTAYKDENPLQGMQLPEKEAQKD